MIALRKPKVRTAFIHTGLLAVSTSDRPANDDPSVARYAWYWVDSEQEWTLLPEPAAEFRQDFPSVEAAWLTLCERRHMEAARLAALQAEDAAFWARERQRAAARRLASMGMN